MTTIRLLLSDECRRRLGSAADQLPAGLVHAAETDPAPDIIVTDDPRAAPPREIAAPWDAPAGPAIVAVGWSGPADAVLPADATGREVALACGLVQEIVRLRGLCLGEQQQRQHLQRLAHSDPLTTLPNRRAWDQECVRRLARLIPLPHPLVLALVDLDHFKGVNSSGGYAAGDQLLRTAATALANSLRATDFVARIGGDEFGLLLEECTAPQPVLDRVLQSIAAASTAAGPRVTASVGYAAAHPGDTLGNLMERADAALRQAKASGRNCARRADW
ncbi:MAG: GGDEF domain-containing protein [Pirellulaceae bacterium]